MHIYRPLLLAITLTAFYSCGNDKPPTPPKPIVINQPPINNANGVARHPMLDKSPMDMIYLPADYPILKMSGKVNEPPVARVIYSRPMKDGRAIFGNIVEYGSYWRLGANESTEIEFFRNVTVNGQPVKKGRYIIYCIPEENQWTLRLNSDLYTWGLKVHQTGDLYSFTIPVTRTPRPFDVFTMQFEGSGKEYKLVMGWDSTVAELPISL